MAKIEPLKLGLIASVPDEIHHNNVCPVWRCAVDISGEGMKYAYVKVVTPRQFLSESICATVGRAVGLSIPSPILVKVNPKLELPEALQSEDYLFGSEAFESINFARLLGKDSPRATKLLNNWGQLHATCAFDELSANADRHLGNILVNAKNDIKIIDHSHALTGDQWQHIHDASYRCGNLLIDTAISHNIPHLQRAPYRKAAHALSWKAAQVLDSEIKSAIPNFGQFQEADLSTAIEFILERVKNVESMVCERVGFPMLEGFNDAVKIS